MNIFLNNENYFINNFYYITIIFYVIIHFLFRINSLVKIKKISFFLADLVVISIFLFDKNLFSTINYVPYFILTLVSIYYTQKFLSFFVFICLIQISILIVNKFILFTSLHLIPVILYTFLFSFYVKKIFQELNSNIIKMTGDLFAENINENTTHHILNKVKKSINDNKIGNLLNIVDIYLFKEIQGRLVVVKGTQFINETKALNLTNNESIINSNEFIITNDEIIEINNIKYDNSIWIKNKIQKSKYFFLICIETNLPFFYERIINGLSPVFYQISRIFYLTNLLDRTKKEELKIIKEKITYVIDAKNALHFVKNKLTPITTTIGLVDRYFKGKSELNTIQIDFIEDKLKNNKSNIYLKEVIEKAEMLIKGVDNLIYKEDRIVNVKVIIDSLRNNWMNHFENTDEVKIKIKDLEEFNYSFNEDLFEYIYTDLIENIYKYGGNHKLVEFIDIDDKLHINFTNNVKDFEKNYIYLKEISDSYNHPENDEIYNRKTHGLSFIRRLLKSKKIINKIIIDRDNKLFTFRIEFKKLKNENFDI